MTASATLSAAAATATVTPVAGIAAAIAGSTRAGFAGAPTYAPPALAPAPRSSEAARRSAEVVALTKKLYDGDTRRVVEAFMREQIEQHAWLIDTSVRSLRTWWPYVNLCTAVAELTWLDAPREATWLLAQVDVDEFFASTDAADQLEAFHVLSLDAEHVPILLEAAVQIETAGYPARAAPR